MPDVPAYERDPTLTRLETSIVEVGTTGGRPFAVLADTVIAVVITTLIYLAFDKLLTLSLPAGPLERLL